MRKISLSLAVVALYGTVAWAGEVVHLNGPADVEQLRQSNPSHYRQAVKIMDKANQLCGPHDGQIEFTVDANTVSCSQMLLRTSNPAKREITFRLDDTQYVALVAMTVDPAKLVAATSK